MSVVPARPPGFKIRVTQTPPTVQVEFTDPIQQSVFRACKVYDSVCDGYTRRKTAPGATTIFQAVDLATAEKMAKKLEGLLKDTKYVIVKGIGLHRSTVLAYFEDSAQLQELLSRLYQGCLIVGNDNQQQARTGDLVLYYMSRNFKCTSSQLAELKSCEFAGLTHQVVMLTMEDLEACSSLQFHIHNIRRFLPYIAEHYQTDFIKFANSFKISLQRCWASNVGSRDQVSLCFEVVGLRKYFFMFYQKILSWLQTDLKMCIKAIQMLGDRHRNAFMKRVNKRMQVQREQLQNAKLTYYFVNNKLLLLLDCAEIDSDILYELASDWNNLGQCFQKEERMFLLRDRLMEEEWRRMLVRQGGVEYVELVIDDERVRGEDGTIYILCDQQNFLKARAITRGFLDMKLLVPRFKGFYSSQIKQCVVRELTNAIGNQHDRSAFRQIFGSENVVFQLNEGLESNLSRLDYLTTVKDSQLVNQRLQQLQTTVFIKFRTILVSTNHLESRPSFSLPAGSQLITPKNLSVYYKGFFDNFSTFESGMGRMVTTVGVGTYSVGNVVLPFQIDREQCFFLSPVCNKILGWSSGQPSHEAFFHKIFADSHNKGRSSNNRNNYKPPLNRTQVSNSSTCSDDAVELSGVHCQTTPFQIPQQVITILVSANSNNDTANLRNKLKKIIDDRKNSPEASILWFVVPTYLNQRVRGVDYPYISQVLKVVKKYLNHSWKQNNVPRLKAFGFICSDEANKKQFEMLLDQIFEDSVKRVTPCPGPDILDWVAQVALKTYSLKIDGTGAQNLQALAIALMYYRRIKAEQSSFKVLVPSPQDYSHPQSGLQEILLHVMSQSVLNLTKFTKYSLTEWLQVCDASTRSTLTWIIQNSPPSQSIHAFYLSKDQKLSGRLYQLYGQTLQPIAVAGSKQQKGQPLKFQLLRDEAHVQLVLGSPDTLLDYFR